MEQLIPRTLRRWENYQTSLAKSAVLQRFQAMTKGQMTMRVDGDRSPYSFGYGKKIQAEMNVHNERFFTRFLGGGELAFGESFVDGDWDSPDLVDLIRWFFVNMEHLNNFARMDMPDQPLFQVLHGLHSIQNLINHARPTGFSDAISAHYELERPFFSLMLDPSLSNSGGLFLENDTLESAQLRKQRRIARELRIRPGDTVLELGCGWGSLAIYLAMCYECTVTAVTISEEQFRYISHRVDELNLRGKVIPLHQDYRAVKGTFDRIVTVELIDTLELSELPGFFSLCESWLKPHGIMLHQLLLTPEPFRSDRGSGAEWIHKYISPGSLTPSMGQLIQAMNEGAAGFCIRRLRDMGLSYAKTLNAWSLRFSHQIDRVKDLGFDDRFIRSWRYYLAYAEAAFDHGLLTAAQITLTRSTQRTQEEDDSAL